MSDSELESTNRLLRVIISIMLRPASERPTTLRQTIEVLSGLGLRPTEIAKILGRTETYVNKELSGLRKGRKL
jgi:hypothetical protein